jgi:hypothetical protein
VIILGKYVTIFNKTRIWCKCTRTKVHMKLFSSVDKIMEKCFFPVIHHLAVIIKANSYLLNDLLNVVWFRIDNCKNLKTSKSS